ncbi:MAG: hypothetical protein V8K32_10800 [Candidatus Electrothrix gigas]
MKLREVTLQFHCRCSLEFMDSKALVLDSSLVRSLVPVRVADKSCCFHHIGAYHRA